MPVYKLIKIQDDGSLKSDLYFEKKDKTFIQELRENLTPEVRKKITKHINKILKKGEEDE